jgi:hypothetical protein
MFWPSLIAINRCGMKCRRRGAPGADRIVDVMPANFTYAGLVHPALSNARGIHVRRSFLYVVLLAVLLRQPAIQL